MVRSCFGLAMLLALSALAAPAWAQSGPRQTVEEANRRIQKLVAERVADGSPAGVRRDGELRRIVTELLELGQMAEDALGREWQKRTPAERAEYAGLLERLVERSYLRQARQHREYSVTFDAPTTLPGGRTEVPSEIRVTRRGRTETIEVVYTMLERAGRWRVVDIETDGVSTIRNYRSQFRRIIDQDGFPALLERMRSRLAAGEVDL